jgi:hypothetical protein
MSVGLNRASIFSIKEEVTSGVYVAPSTGSDFVPLRPGNETSYEPEQLESDELLNDIGTAKSFVGKEVVSGSHSAYLKHSGVEGQEPQLGVLYESVMGNKNITSTERDSVGTSTVNAITVGAGEGVEFPEGKALLVKASSGYVIRNVKSVSGDVLTLNFSLPSTVPATTNLGKAITYLPVAQGHPTFSTTKFLGNGFAKEVTAGNTATEVSFTMDANGFGEVEFSYEGTKYYFNPITITASNKFLDVTDDGGTFAVSIAEKIYKTPVELADAIASALDASSAETYTVTYSSITGKFTIASGSTLLSLLWNTGTNSANSIGATLGFSVVADDTGAVTYTSDIEQVYTSAITPSYDNADAIIIKGAELFIGNQVDNICICAQSVSLTVSKEVEDVDCICEESGVAEKIPTGRTVEMSVTASLKKHDVALLDALLKNSGLSAMMNAGPKTGGNWIPGKCFNAYLQNCTVSSYKTTGDSFIQAEITLKGFVTSTGKDLFLNFV